MTVLDELLVRMGVDMSDAEDEVDRGSQGILDRLGGLEVAGGAAAALLGKAFSDGLEYAMDASAAETKLQNQLGLTDQEADRAGRLAGKVFSAGFGESIDGVDEALGAVSQNLGGFADLSDQQLVQLTKDAQALADTFEFDVGESSQAAGQLIKAGLAKDGTDAFDLLTRAAQELPPAMREELPDLTKEYSGFFQQIGATGPQMFGILTEAAKNPLFELDKLGDAVKEFTLRIGDTQAVSTPLKQLGLDVGHIQKLVNTGHGTQAFDEVNKALAGVTDQTKRTMIQSALFGGPGEDMANTLKAISDQGGFAGAKLDNVSGAAKKVTDNMASSPGQAWDSIWRTVTVTMGDMLLPVLRFVSDLLEKYPGIVQTAVPVVLAVAAALAIWAAIQWALNSALLANPVTWIILAIVALITIIILIATRTTWFQTIWHTVWGAITSAFDATVAFLKDRLSWLQSLPGKFADWFGRAKDTAIAKFIALNLWVASLPGKLWDALSGLAGRLHERASSAFQAMKTAAILKAASLVLWVHGIPGRIVGAIGDLGSLLYNAGRSVISGLLRGITSMLGSLRSKLGSITSMIPDLKGPMDVDMRLLTPSGEAIMSGFMDGIDNQVPALRKQLAGVTSSIPAATANVSLAPSVASGRTGGELVVRYEGDSDSFNTWLRQSVHVLGGGSVQKAYGYGQ